MRTSAGFARNLFHIDCANKKRIGDQRTVTAPGNGFRAHDCGSLVPRQLNQLFEGDFKLRSLHVVGKSAEACISPGGIDGVTACMPQAAERRHMQVMNSSLLQGI
jgi:hypothetical protein